MLENVFIKNEKAGLLFLKKIEIGLKINGEAHYFSTKQAQFKSFRWYLIYSSKSKGRRRLFRPMRNTKYKFPVG